jgi:dihydrofolate reductase
MTLTLVAAMARNRVIGRDGDMPWHHPEDLAHFKRTTLGGTMVMGRKTFEAIGRPLPGRRTVVVTRSADWAHDGVDVAHSLDEALASSAADEIFVVGGGDVYAQALPLADRLVLTEIDDEPDGDTFFPEWPREEWVETSRERSGPLSFVTWERRQA